jgi:hypothetical protein
MRVLRKLYQLIFGSTNISVGHGIHESKIGRDEEMEALRAATDAIHEYCAHNSEWAKVWLLRANNANRKI